MNYGRILIVTDDKGTTHPLLDYLAESGYEVLVAHAGETALHTIRREKPDLVVLDSMFPDRGGLEITRTIREDPRLFRLPIILLGACATVLDIATGLDSGADDYVTGPFTPRELGARVRAVLRRCCREGLQAGPY
jgi:DNA-binding response OmpR family regulator